MKDEQPNKQTNKQTYNPENMGDPGASVGPAASTAAWREMLGICNGWPETAVGLLEKRFFQADFLLPEVHLYKINSKFVLGTHGTSTVFFFFVCLIFFL